MMFIYFLLLISCCYALPHRGHHNITLNTENGFYKSISKSMFKGTFIDIEVTCDIKKNVTLTIRSKILECLNIDPDQIDEKDLYSVSHFETSEKFACSKSNPGKIIHNKLDDKDLKNIFMNNSNDHFLISSKDGIYRFDFKVESDDTSPVYLTVDLKSSYGYLSASEWPLLVFYSVMCGLYALLAFVWLVLSGRNWRDLLRIQFWIGAVIFLGMLEKALFVSEYESINQSGVPLNYPVLIAEVVSCVKRMLARILIMIVCIGYGIVKPRLGPAMKKIIGVGVAYLIAALTECFIRVLRPDLAHSKYILIPELALVIVDVIIMWWSFSYLIQTIKEMRIRHNIVKFNLYRHFSNILIIVIIASVLYMSWYIYTFKSTKCVTSWKELWVNSAFWQVLFSIVLMTIMVLWRPSKNSQRYAYSPLLDEENFDMDDDEEENVTMDNLTSGELRKPNKDGKEKKVTEKKTAEDDLRWIEENIPASAAEKIYPIVDSEEELTSTKITNGKMD